MSKVNALANVQVEVVVSVEEDIRQLLRSGSETRYAISNATGIAESQLSRFLNGQSLRSHTLEKLANHLGHEIVLRRKKKRS